MRAPADGGGDDVGAGIEDGGDYGALARENGGDAGLEDAGFFGGDGFEGAAEEGWRDFKLGDFERLKAAFGVNWVLVNYPQPKGLACRWHNHQLAVCQIP